jgi:polysaccharide biosynthesis transport protein
VLMLWLERRDRTVRRVEDVEIASGLPVLGAAARGGSGSHRGGTRGMLDIWVALRNDVESALPQGQSVLLAVPVGSSTGAAHAVASLAAAFGRTGMRVAVVCADLESDLLPEALGVSPVAPGVTEALSGTPSVEPMSSDAEGVFVLPPGGSHLASRDMLHSRRFADLVSRLRESFDLVVVHALPTDSVAVARACDATALLVETGRSRWDDVEAVVSQLRRAGARVIGTAVLDPRRLESEIGGARAIGWSRRRGGQAPGSAREAAAPVTPASGTPGSPAGESDSPPVPAGVRRGNTVLPDLAADRQRSAGTP